MGPMKVCRKTLTRSTDSVISATFSPALSWSCSSGVSAHQRRSSRSLRGRSSRRAVVAAIHWDETCAAIATAADRIATASSIALCPSPTTCPSATNAPAMAMLVKTDRAKVSRMRRWPSSVLSGIGGTSAVFAAWGWGMSGGLVHDLSGSVSSRSTGHTGLRRTEVLIIRDSATLRKRLLAGGNSVRLDEVAEALLGRPSDELGVCMRFEADGHAPAGPGHRVGAVGYQLIAR